MISERGEGLVKPRAPRASMLLRARSINDAGDAFWITVRNLSNEGLGGICKDAPPVIVGELMQLTIRGIRSIDAQVAWIDGERIGIAFQRNFNPARLNINGWWQGPDFKVAEMHQISETCYRPATQQHAFFKR
jgi:hypothetical protein